MSTQEVDQSTKAELISHKHLKPITPVCISYYLALADDGIIEISHEEYLHYATKLNHLLDQDRQQQISDDQVFIKETQQIIKSSI